MKNYCCCCCCHNADRHSATPLLPTKKKKRFLFLNVVSVTAIKQPTQKKLCLMLDWLTTKNF